MQAINVANKDEFGDSGSNRTNLSNLSASTRSTGAGYITSRGAKRGVGNTKKGVKAAKDSDYLTTAAKKAFNHLRHAFTQAAIFQHFDLKWHIRIETDTSGYAIGEVLSQLILNELGQWHPVVYYLRKIITAKT